MKLSLKSICPLLLLIVALAACSSGGGTEADIATQTAPPDAPATTGPALEVVPRETTETIHEGATGEAYPPPATAAPDESGYPPAAPEEQTLPTAYPDATGSMPPTELDPAALTPVVIEAVTPSAVQERLIEAAARDLNLQTDVPVDEIELLSAVSVVWPNAGLGCPEAGMNYIEVQVEGMLITLGAGGNEFSYHTDGSNNYVLCRDGARVSSGIIP